MRVSDSRLGRYAGALASVAVAVAIRGSLNPVLGTRLPLVTVSVAVIVSARYFGAGPRSTVDWRRLDTTLANLKRAGVDNVFYTLNRTPEWATPHPDDSNCDYGRGECWPPLGLNLDGSGPNLIWKDWVSRIAHHVNDPKFRKNHAHIKYWEPWNEWFDDSYFGWGPKVGAHLTYAQMLRLTEDLRCVVTGKGTIHNYPKAGDATPCSAKPIDPSALISTPSDSPDCCMYAMQNFLYCSSHIKLNDLGNSSTCTWGEGRIGDRKRLT